MFEGFTLPMIDANGLPFASATAAPRDEKR
jgi:hypothetical protein